MGIKVQCDSCKKRFLAPSRLAGRKVECPECGYSITIPVPEAKLVSAEPVYQLGDTELVDGPEVSAPAAQPWPAPFDPLQGPAAAVPQRPAAPQGGVAVQIRLPVGLIPLTGMAAAAALVVFLILLIFSPAGALRWAGIVYWGSLFVAVLAGIWMWSIVYRTVGFRGTLRVYFRSMLHVLIFQPVKSMEFWVANWKRVRQPFWTAMIALGVCLASAGAEYAAVRLLVSRVFRERERVEARADRPRPPARQPAPQPVRPVTPSPSRPTTRSAMPFRLASVYAPAAQFQPPRRLPCQEPNVGWEEIRLSGTGQAGQSGRLWVYLPEGDHPPRSLPCVLIGPAGTNLISGIDLGSGDQPEHFPYVRAGFAVVAFELDGKLLNPDNPADADILQAYEKFAAAGAGLVNARNAFSYATTKIPEVDPRRVYVAGHSSAATLALLFAEHENRLAGCIAFAPCTDLLTRMADVVDDLQRLIPGSRDFLRETSPITEAHRLRCPLFLFHARDDSNVPFRESQAFADQLRGLGRQVTFETVPTGDHYQSMISDGIPRAIEWIRQQNAASAPPPPTTSITSGSPRPPTPPTTPTPTPSSSSVRPQDLPTPPSEVPDIWNVQPEASAQRIQVPQDLGISMPLEARVFGTVLFPATPSRFAALGHNANETGVMAVWNLETGEQVGATLAGEMEMYSREKDLALSPDGRFLAGKRTTAAGQRGTLVSLWSFADGQHVTDLQVSDASPWLHFLQFASPSALVTAVRPTLGVHEVRIWSVPEGQLHREILVKSQDRDADAFVLSPTGRYLAAPAKHLMIYDLTTGELAGARPLPDTQRTAEWKCQGAAFSHDATELAAIFDVGDSMKIVAWNLADGSVVLHHTAPGNWYPRLEGFKRYDGPKIEWFADKKGWLIAGYAAVERESGGGAWQLRREPSEPVRLTGGNQLLGLTGGGMSDTLVACNVSLEKPPDFDNHPAAAPKNPFPRTPGLVGVVRLQILGYGGQGDQLTAARSSLRGIPWADPTAVLVDPQRKEIVIGVRISAVNTRMAKEALQRAGFQIGYAAFSAL